VLAWIDGPRGKRRVRDHVYRRTLARFAEAGIEIPFPQRVVHLPASLTSGDGHAGSAAPHEKAGVRGNAAD